MEETILVSEIFGPTIQGEGAMVGRSTVFVRTGGCDFKCVWCDSMHAVDLKYKDQWRAVTAEDILNEVTALAPEPILITLSGGNPALQPLMPLITTGKSRGYTFAMETQGSVAKPWFAHLDHLILSPKPPSSGMGPRFRLSRLEDCIAAARCQPLLRPELSLKVVVMDQRDYDFAKMVLSMVARPLGIPFYITPGNSTPPQAGRFSLTGVIQKTAHIVEWLNRDRITDAAVIPQLHTIIWGNKQGV